MANARIANLEISLADLWTSQVCSVHHVPRRDLGRGVVQYRQRLRGDDPRTCGAGAPRESLDSEAMN